jgi:putative transposase
VAAFRARPLDAGPYAYVWLDALAVKCREAGRIVNVAGVVATACNRARAGATGGEYGGRVPCGSGWAVPACVVGWSEPGNQAKGGDGS